MGTLLVSPQKQRNCGTTISTWIMKFQHHKPRTKLQSSSCPWTSFLCGKKTLVHTDVLLLGSRRRLSLGMTWWISGVNERRAQVMSNRFDLKSVIEQSFIEVIFSVRSPRK